MASPHNFAAPFLEPDSLTATCVHESGHAVIAEALGIPVIYATSRGNSERLGSVKLEDPREIIGVGWQACAILAGPVAQQGWTFGSLDGPLELERFGGRNDIDAASACLEEVLAWESGGDVDFALLPNRIAECANDTRALVGEFWPAIAEAAFRMRRRRTLTAYDIKEALRTTSRSTVYGS